ncbi:uncharacterized protein LOC132760350 [Ruditapes philippinarum]|uniref:uncharacterized protein LOC132760350 n=1 Tax=Ruditapes philippinarum TaxID=129788 RepID=UPI00295C2395|nr:uncharacterized protein LOC132760350 [Ruditapes philippinarum]XP_060608311.1 uncharacterized protein LOC132760350 [Ruditapes philippinarum]
MESGTFYCLSLTSEKDGTFRSARIPFSPESHSFENGSKLRRTVQEGDDLCINVNGTGTSMISVQNGIFTTIPLYYLNIKNQMTVQIFIKLTENGEKVKATFNNETFEIQVDAEKKVQIELLLLTGSFRTVLAIEGKDVYRQTFEVVSEENSNVCFTNETCSTDISDVVESHSADSTRANDPQGDKMCNKIYSKKDENDLSQFNVDKGIIEMIKNVERNKDVDYNGICDELGSNDETEVLERDEEINLSVDSSDSNANAFSVGDKIYSLLKEP